MGTFIMKKRSPRKVITDVRRQAKVSMISNPFPRKNSQFSKPLSVGFLALVLSLASLPNSSAQELSPGNSLPFMPIPAGTQTIAAPNLSFVDINSGRFGKLEIDMLDGQFCDGACENIHLTAREMDFNLGELKSLDIEAKGAHLRDFIIDKLTLSTQGALNFDTRLLLNHKTLQFNSPAQAQVTAIISQDSLNKFLKAPNTLDRLSYSVTQKNGVLASILGSAAGGPAGLIVEAANINLQKGNKVNVTAGGKVGVGQLSIPLNAQLESQLYLENGWVFMKDTKLMTAGQEISPQLSEILVKKINSLSNIGSRSDDIQFSFTDLKVIPGRQLVVSGTAQVNRLRFGRQS
jgi:hypothetical protein